MKRKTGPLRRALIYSAIAISLGALTAIAVAWSCAAWPVPNFRAIRRGVNLDRDRDESAGEGRGYLSLHGMYDFGTLRLYSVASQQGINGMYYNYNPASAPPHLPFPLLRAVLPWPHGREPWPPDGVEDRRYIAAAGWPLLALYSVSGDRSDANRPTPHTGIPTPNCFYPDSLNQGPRLFYLPTTPIPLGFTADTVLFAVPWFAIFFTPRLIRALRRRPGSCPHCRYDLRGLPPDSRCPECGGTRA